MVLLASFEQSNTTILFLHFFNSQETFQKINLFSHAARNDQDFTKKFNLHPEIEKNKMDFQENISSKELTEDVISKIFNHLNLKIERSFLPKANISCEAFIQKLIDNFIEPEFEKLAVFLSICLEKSKKNLDIFEEYENNSSVSKKIIERMRQFDIKLKDNFEEETIVSLKTLQKGGYIIQNDGVSIETPDEMFRRVVCQIHSDVDKAKRSFELLSKREICHASPTLFNSGTTKPQLSSCFLCSLKEDSIEGISDTRKEMMMISKLGGGIGIDLTNLRSKGRIISSTGKECKGIIPLLSLLENESQYLDNCCKRRGTICVYLELTHPDVIDFINFKKHNRVPEFVNKQTQNLFSGLWVSDLFMKRCSENEMWSFFAEKERLELSNVFGEEFEKLFEKFEKENLQIKKINSNEILKDILESQCQTGGPFICFKDTANKLSNQINAGIIRSSNLCTEIFEVSNSKETASCNLACLNLEKCIEDGKVNFEKISFLVDVLVENLNKVIDENYYCNEMIEKNNLKMRPIGIGVAGFHSFLLELNIPFDSAEARRLNKKLFEVIYFQALTTSCRLSKETCPYEKFEGSPLSKGETHVDLFEKHFNPKIKLSISEEKWKELKENVKKFGVKNSLHIALMPTVSTSSILNTSEGFEAIENFVLEKKTRHGNFISINKQFRNLLISKNKLNEDVLTKVIKEETLQNLDFLSKEEKEVWKTSWEIDPKAVIDLAIGRAPFIDQSQSMSLHFVNPWEEQNRMKSLLFYSWRHGLKTGNYYIRSKPASSKKVSCVSCQ